MPKSVEFARRNFILSTFRANYRAELLDGNKTRKNVQSRNGAKFFPEFKGLKLGTVPQFCRIRAQELCFMNVSPKWYAELLDRNITRTNMLSRNVPKFFPQFNGLKLGIVSQFRRIRAQEFCFMNVSPKLFVELLDGNITRTNVQSWNVPNFFHNLRD